MSDASCYRECKKFFQTGKEEDLGDITKTRTCSYCLYWNVGPGSENTQCQCDGLFMKLTNNGNKYNLDIHNQVKDCLSNNMYCGKEYIQFTNPPEVNDRPHFGGRFRDVGKESYDSTKCVRGPPSPGFSNVGVL